LKDSEKKALKEAFGIPEPQNKAEFLSSIENKAAVSERKPRLPVFFRYAAAAVCAVVVITAGVTVLKTAAPDKNFGSSSVMTETAPDTQKTTEYVSENIGTVTGVTTAAVTTAPVTETASVTSSVQTTSEAASTSPQTTSLQTTTVTASTTHKTTNTTAAVNTTTCVTTTEFSATKTEEITTTFKSEELVDPVMTTATSYEKPETTTTTNNSKETGGTPPVSSDDPGTDDRTVKPYIIYNVTGKTIEPSDSIVPPPGTADYPYDQLAKASDYVIYGNIDNIYYTSINGIPYTQADIEISRVFKGSDISGSTRISVYFPGGYYPINRESDTESQYYVFESSGMPVRPNVNDSYLLFIKSGYSVFPYGAFVLTEESGHAVMYKDKTGYIPANNINQHFTISDIYGMIYD